MHTSILSTAVVLLSLGLALDNGAGSGLHSWNTNTAQLTSASSDHSAITNGSFIKETAIIQIQIGNLTGSGVIKLSNVASEASELSGLLKSTSFTNQYYPTNAPSSQTTFCPSNTSSAFLYQGTSARNFNSTVKVPQAQPSVGPIPLSSPIFTGSGSPMGAGLPKFPATMLALIIHISIVSFI